ncbi:hypothetical protein K8089_06345 [Aequorivita sp. F47161]|uniref:Uncharacterized protein n=1 Tax=Aequorivita vitellina TaxID=2874475 RepID=A0A9X1U2V9_9FLAO|nr:hypothetical protein [Aequorivita vitellina]MCG2418637.1 hypothetical protein [Aequorivita vitellina]MCZ4319564.1 hypothetical protein [Aequorivita viscosa]
MKKTLLIIALAAFTAGFAQENKNKKTETVVTKTAVTSEKGTDVSTKAVTKTKKQVLQLDDSDANQTNQSVVMKPAKVNTEVSYGYDGNRFQFLNQKDKDGYRLMTVKDNASNEEYAIIKPTSQNGYYIMSRDGNSSFGYFNENGNFVVERYDSQKGEIVTDVYKLHISSDSAIKK